MRTKEVKILGKTYLMNFSNAVLMHLEKSGIKLDDIAKSDVPVTQMLEIIVKMIKSGSKYSEKIGGPKYPVIELDDLAESTDADELNALMTDAAYCMIGDRKVLATPKKKEEAPEADQMN